LQLILGQFYKIHKITNKDIFVLCNFGQHIHFLKQRKDTREPTNESMSHKTFNFFKTMSFFALLICIFRIKRRYFMYICFVEDSMEIHFIFTFLKSLFFFMFNKSTSFWNSTNFFGLWTKQAYKICKMPFSQCIWFWSNKWPSHD
jgi:hypothetical protein